MHYLATFFVSILLIQFLAWGGSALLSTRFRCRQQSSREVLSEPISIVLMAAGLSETEAQTAGSVFHIVDENCEIIVVADHAEEAVCRSLREQLAPHCAVPTIRFVYGRIGSSHNPKLDSMRVGLAAARFDVVLVLDGNVSVPPNLLKTVRSAWSAPDCVMSSLPQAVGDEKFWSQLEALWINNVYWRWVHAGVEINVPVSIGKLLVFRRSWLEAQGGVQRLLECAAEDGALTVLALDSQTPITIFETRAQFELHQRGFSAIWSRAVRWALIRRKDRPLVYLIEVLNTLVVALLLGACWGQLTGRPILPLWLAIGAYWHVLEALLSVSSGSWSPRIHLYALVRDCLTLPVWFMGWLKSGYSWRGRTIDLNSRAYLSDAFADGEHGNHAQQPEATAREKNQKR